MGNQQEGHVVSSSTVDLFLNGQAVFRRIGNAYELVCHSTKAALDEKTTAGAVAILIWPWLPQHLAVLTNGHVHVETSKPILPYLQTFGLSGWVVTCLADPYNERKALQAFEQGQLSLEGLRADELLQYAFHSSLQEGKTKALEFRQAMCAEIKRRLGKHAEDKAKPKKKRRRRSTEEDEEWLPKKKRRV